MWSPSWLRFRKDRRSVRPDRAAVRTRLSVEPLEDRTLLSFGFGGAFGFGGPPSTGYSGNDEGTSIVTDNQGDVFVAGWQDSQNINMNPAGTPVILPGGHFEGFVAEYRSDNTLVWAKDLGPSVDARLALQGSNLYVAYAPWIGSTAGPYNVVAARLNAADGSTMWTTNLATSVSFQSSDPHEGFHASVAVGPSGSVYVASDNTSTQAFVARLDPTSGAVGWTKSTSGGSANATGVAVDGSENVFLTGDYTGATTFGATRSSSNSGTADAFAWKLDSAGNSVWTGSLGGNGTDGGRAIAVDGTGNVFITGNFGYAKNVSKNNDFDPGLGVSRLTHSSNGNDDIFVVKLAPNPDGSLGLAWARDIGGTGVNIPRGLALDGAGNVYLTGGFAGATDFDPGSGSYVLQTSSVTDFDIFVCKLDASGNFVSAVRAGSAGFNDGASAITVDSSGTVYTTGGFRMTVNFDPTGGTYDLTAQGYSLMDVFVWKLTQF